MSFSSRTKSELALLTIANKCCMIAELTAIISFASNIKNNAGKIYMTINTENAAIARRIFNLIKKVFNIDISIKIKKSKIVKHLNLYSLYIHGADNINTILKGTKLINEEKSHAQLINYRINNKIIENNCCKKSFIRGAFLGNGSMINPEKTYHLEFVTNYYLLSNDLKAIFANLKLKPKIIRRKSKYVIYFKGSDEIVYLLNIMGAHKSLMKLENIRIMKEMRNNVNRIVNCETANLEKTVNASLQQIYNIELIDKTIGLKDLPKNLQEVALLRLKYREATLKELGEMLKPAIGKSGVNHRLRKIENIAKNIIDKK